MFIYRKRFFYPVHVEDPDPVLAKILLEHYAGRESEFTSLTQYLNHRSNMSNRYISELLGLIAAEEMGHMELIAAAMVKLGGPAPSYPSRNGASWDISYVDQSTAPLSMLEADIDAEARAQVLYNKHLAIINDSGLKRMLTFLANREEVHKQLLEKAKSLLMQRESGDQFTELIYEYKMSLQVLE